MHADDGAFLVHERLAIVDPAGGSQPLRSADGELVLAVNGEIYNHRALEETGRPYAFQTGSDCEVINALYREQVPASFLTASTASSRSRSGTRHRAASLVARDPMGVCPLYWGHDGDGRLWVASEMKALVRVCDDVCAVPAGPLFRQRDRRTGALLRQAVARSCRDARRGRCAAANCAKPSKRAVHRQLMSDVPYGVLLSGGLDSSLVAACAARFARRRVEDDDIPRPGGRACIRSRSAWKVRPTWPRRKSRPGARHRAPRVHLHLRGRPGCVAGSDPPYRDLRRHHHTRVDADVPAGTPDQGDGREDGAVGRGLPTRSSAATCTSTRRPMRANSMTRPCASSMRYTASIACARTRR